uniref:Protein Red n=2 Tax=Plectus sambesii TaxID=2011161 RepID=A0A914VZK1_9BILA
MEAVYQSVKEEREETEANMKAPLARNIYRLLFKDEPPKTNDLFAPRRMAYVIELDDEYAESDIPTTLLRSKQDCPIDDTTANLSTNDMVIQKLTQVLSYLRADTKRKKKDKPEVESEDLLKHVNRSIFDDAGEYVPNVKSEGGSKKGKAHETYFEKPEASSSSSRKDRERPHDKDHRRRDEGERSRDRDHHRRDHRDRRERDRPSRTEATQEPRLAEGFSPADLALKRRSESHGRTDESKARSGDSAAGVKRAEEHLAKTGNAQARAKGDIQLTATDSYAECYPGGVEMFEAAGESDDEADYTRMDAGSKKGPVKRWDFETSEEYEDYQNQREALPKAAYQYGVKMNDGRKTRKTGPGAAERDNKQKIDKQWNQISRILEKRKDGGAASEDSSKKIKY